MADKKTSDSPRPRSADLLPNEQEISYDHVHRYFDRNKAWIGGLCLMLILGAGWLFFSRQQENNARVEANAKLAQAQAQAQSTHSMEGLLTVAHDYPGTDAATIAMLMMADNYYQQQDWQKAFSLYKQVASETPSSQLAPSAFIGLAAISEATGKMADAIKGYQVVVNTFPDSFQAAQAQFAAARLFEDGGQWSEARKAYEDLIRHHPTSAWRGEAEEHLDRVTDLLKTKSPESKT